MEVYDPDYTHREIQTKKLVSDEGERETNAEF